MMRIAVCDDEADDLLHNKECIRTELLGRGITEFEVDMFERPDKLFDTGKPYNLIFLDIEMPGMNGIDTAKLMRERGMSTPFVYITNHSDYAFAAYAVFPLSLIKKPIYPATLRPIMDEFLRRTASSLPKCIELQTDSGFRFLAPSEIIYFNCIAKRDIIAVTENGSSITITERFDDLYGKIAKYNFFKIRRDIIINLSHVKAVDSANRVVMSNETVLNVSHRTKNDFLSALSETVIAEFTGR
jgi:DNA-binding LytR/AlgR family response regulator